MIAGRNCIRSKVSCHRMSERVVLQTTTQGPDCTVVGDLSQRDDRRQFRQGGDCCDKELPTGVDLLANWLVFRRYAPNGVGDHAISQLQSIVRALTVGALRKAVLEQRRIQQITRIIAGERASGPVRAAHPGRKTDNQQPCITVPKTGDRRIEPIRILFAQRRPVIAQARAQVTVRWRFGRCVRRQGAGSESGSGQS